MWPTTRRFKGTEWPGKRTGPPLEPEPGLPLFGSIAPIPIPVAGHGVFGNFPFDGRNRPNISFSNLILPWEHKIKRIDN
jgi:hypothetical protein